MHYYAFLESPLSFGTPCFFLSTSKNKCANKFIVSRPLFQHMHRPTTAKEYICKPFPVYFRNSVDFVSKIHHYINLQ